MSYKRVGLLTVLKITLFFVYLFCLVFINELLTQLHFYNDKLYSPDFVNNAYRLHEDGTFFDPTHEWSGRHIVFFAFASTLTVYLAILTIIEIFNYWHSLIPKELLAGEKEEEVKPDYPNFNSPAAPQSPHQNVD